MEEIPFLSLKENYISEKNKISRIIKKVLKSGIYILGEELRKFEQEFAKYNKSNYAIGVASGTDALFLTLKALNIKSGDEVIIQANTALPTACAISMTGAKPVFVDIKPDSFELDPNLIKRKITKNTKAIVIVHLYGEPGDLKEIISIANKYKIKVIEDCAQAHGAKYNGRKVGAFGIAGCFSFYPTKNLGAYGDGGMIITKNKKLAEKIKLLREYGQKQKNLSIMVGFNSRLDEIQAALLRIKLKTLDKINKIRQKKASLYNKLLKDCQVTIPSINKIKKNVFHLYVIRTPKRDTLKKYLKSKGIETMIHYPYPLHLQPLYKSLGYKKNSLPQTEKRAKEILSLPLYPHLPDNKINLIAKEVTSFLGSRPDSKAYRGAVNTRNINEKGRISKHS